MNALPDIRNNDVFQIHFNIINGLEPGWLGARQGTYGLSYGQRLPGREIVASRTVQRIHVHFK